VAGGDAGGDVSKADWEVTMIGISEETASLLLLIFHVFATVFWAYATRQCISGERIVRPDVDRIFIVGAVLLMAVSNLEKAIDMFGELKKFYGW